MTQKLCRKCNKVKSADEFHKLNDGLQPYCKSCRSAYNKQYTKTHYSQEKRRANNLREQYNMTIAEYEALLLKNNGCCWICNVPEHELRRRLAVDHCHKTGQIRGLLCDRCNKGLGLLGDSLQSIEYVLQYLKRS